LGDWVITSLLNYRRRLAGLLLGEELAARVYGPLPGETADE